MLPPDDPQQPDPKPAAPARKAKEEKLSESYYLKDRNGQVQLVMRGSFVEREMLGQGAVECDAPGEEQQDEQIPVIGAPVTQPRSPIEQDMQPNPALIPSHDGPANP